tara:strand:+ start:1040 stop:1471 length:432 start_codon:yes stop_codon:yes gene_type:complete
MGNLISHSIWIMGTLADRLRERTKELGVSQADLARATGAKSPSVNKWFSGQTQNLKGKNLVKAAEFLRVSEAWLADGVGPKERSFTHGSFLSISQERYDLLSETQKKAIEEWVDAQITAYTGIGPDNTPAQKATGTDPSKKFA